MRLVENEAEREGCIDFSRRLNVARIKKKKERKRKREEEEEERRKNVNSSQGLSFFQHLCLGNESFLAPKERFRGVSGRGQGGCLRSTGMFDDFFKRKFRGGVRLQEGIVVS